MLRRVVLEALKHFEALEGGAGPGHPVLDLDKEIRMLSCIAAVKAGCGRKPSFVLKMLLEQSVSCKR